jgi:hypothetical protein
MARQRMLTVEVSWRIGEGSGARATRLTGGAGWQQGRCQRWGVAPTGGPGQHSARWRSSNSVLNQFKNIQMVQMKFEFPKTLAGSKDTFPHSKNLK